ncbi:protein kinase [Emydomyces testavorans]|uniref:protein-ribulosamine 3-kinase n=1 Tax=Emydomyces testavorans TaxID=2070801 RepID=A0AAF0DNW5_9EURO|nr:protein kinase [Emydomyces testavorans]
MPPTSHPPVPRSLLTALSLPASDPSKATLSTHGHGSHFTTTAHLRVPISDPADPAQAPALERHFFVKMSKKKRDNTLAPPPASTGGTGGAADPAMEMFRGEYASLNAIADVVPEMCPRGLAWGELEQEEGGGGGGWFLATEFLELGRGRGVRRSREAGLARRLARLHCTRAPAPPSATERGDCVVNVAEKKKNGPDGRGDDDGELQFGFPVPTFCGDVRQANEFRRSWAEFYAEQRLRSVLAESEKRNGADRALRELVEKVADTVVPRLLGDGHLGYDKHGSGEGIVPVVVHGDLWSGNTGTGRILRNKSRHDDDVDGGEGDEDVGDVVFDPSACYAHSEFELGIMHLFGGFGRDFYEEYHRLVPKTEPVEEYADRVALYEL